MSKLRVLASETALYGMGSIVPRALNFLLVPLHTRNLFSPAEYGVFTNLLAYVAFLNIVYTFGMETAYFRFATVPGANQKRVFNLVQTVVLSISVSLSVLFIVFDSPIADGLHIGAHPEFIAWLALIMLTDAAVSIPFARLRLERRPLKFATAKIINVLVMIGLNFYFLKINYDPSVGIGFVFLANLLANGFYLLFFAKDLITWRPAIDRFVSPTLLKYAYPVMLTGLAGMTNEMFSRLTLEWWLPPHFYGEKSQAHALGVFAACYKYAVLMSVAIQSFRFTAEPFFFSNAPDKSSPALFSRVNHFFVIACCILLLGVSINMDVLKYFIGKEYWGGLGIVPILLLAYLFLGVYYNFSVWFKVTDKTYFGTLITAGGAVLTIVLNYLLIPVAGYTGSSWAAMIVFLLMAITCYSLGQKYYPIPYRILSDCCYVAVTFLLVYSISKITIGNLWLSIPFHLGVMLIFVLITGLLETKRVKPSADQQSSPGQ